MYIIIIGWLYVVVLMAATESNLTAAIMTLLFYGLLPSVLLFWLFGGTGRARRARRVHRQAQQRLDQLPDGGSATAESVEESVTNNKMDQQDRANAKAD